MTVDLRRPAGQASVFYVADLTQTAWNVRVGKIWQQWASCGGSAEPRISTRQTCDGGDGETPRDFVRMIQMLQTHRARK